MAVLITITVVLLTTTITAALLTIIITAGLLTTLATLLTILAILLTVLQAVARAGILYSLVFLIFFRRGVVFESMTSYEHWSAVVAPRTAWVLL